jgi:hypothetical protein
VPRGGGGGGGRGGGGEETSHVVRSLNRLLHSVLGISRPSDSAHFLKCLLHKLLYFSRVAVPL